MFPEVEALNNYPHERVRDSQIAYHFSFASMLSLLVSLSLSPFIVLPFLRQDDKGEGKTDKKALEHFLAFISGGFYSFRVQMIKILIFDTPRDVIRIKLQC